MCRFSNKAAAIRPHHGMCLAYFEGKGYSEGFSAHMEKMLGIFETGVTVRLTVSTDEICAACPHNAEGSCEAGEKVKAYDRGVLEACGFAEGMEMSFREFAGKVQEKVIDTGIRSKICGDCQWDRICKAAPSKWKKWL